MRTKIGLLAPATSYAALVVADGPAFYFPLDEASGTTAVNGVSNAVGNGTYGGTYTLQGDTVPDGIHKAATFNPGHVVIANNALVHSSGNSLTLECWAKITATPPNSTGGLICKLDSAAGNAEYLLRWDNTNGWDLSLFGAGGTGAGAIANPKWNPGSLPSGWHHVIGLANNTTGKAEMWVDGTMRSQVALGTQASFSGSSVYLATQQNNPNPDLYGHRGAVARCALYQYALTSTQIAAHYAAGLVR